MLALLRLNRSGCCWCDGVSLGLEGFGGDSGSRYRQVRCRCGISGRKPVVQDHVGECAELILGRRRCGVVWARLVLSEPARPGEAVLSETGRVEQVLYVLQRLGQLFRGLFSVVGLGIEPL